MNCSASYLLSIFFHIHLKVHFEQAVPGNQAIYWNVSKWYCWCVASGASVEWECNITYRFVEVCQPCLQGRNARHRFPTHETIHSGAQEPSDSIWWHFRFARGASYSYHDIEGCVLWVLLYHVVFFRQWILGYRRIKGPLVGRSWEIPWRFENGIFKAFLQMFGAPSIGLREIQTKIIKITETDNVKEWLCTIIQPWTGNGIQIAESISDGANHSSKNSVVSSTV